MSEPKRVVQLHPDIDDGRPAFSMTVADLRALIRDEIEAAKKQELPRLLYNTAEAAKILDVPPTWLAAQARAGKIPDVRKGHYVRYRIPDLEEFAARSDGV